MNINSITITRLYDQLSSKLGKETAENLISFIEQKVQDEVKENENAAAGKQALARVQGSPESEGWIRFWEKAKWVLLLITIAELVYAVRLVVLR